MGDHDGHDPADVDGQLPATWFALDVDGSLFGLFPRREDAEKVARSLGGVQNHAVVRDATGMDVAHPPPPPPSIGSDRLAH